MIIIASKIAYSSAQKMLAVFHSLVELVTVSYTIADATWISKATGV